MKFIWTDEATIEERVAFDQELNKRLIKHADETGIQPNLFCRAFLFLRLQKDFSDHDRPFPFVDMDKVNDEINREIINGEIDPPGMMWSLPQALKP